MRPLQGAAVPVLGRDRRSACLVGQQKTNKKQCSFTMLPWVGKLPPEKEMATGSSILAWKIPWAEEPGGLQSMGSQRVRHYRRTLSFAFPSEEELKKALEKGLNVSESKKADARLHPSVKGVGKLF